MRTYMFWFPDDMTDEELEIVVGNATEAIGYALHEKECEAKGAEFYNEGWGVDASNTEISIASKTSKGILTTNYDSSTGKVEHDWEATE